MTFGSSVFPAPETHLPEKDFVSSSLPVTRKFFPSTLVVLEPDDADRG